MAKRLTHRRAKRGRLIKVGGKLATDFCTLAVLAFIFDGDHDGVRLAKFFQDADGNHPPVDEMISMVLVGEGRLLKAPASKGGAE